MNTRTVPFAAVPGFNRLFLDYVSASEKVKPFYDHFPSTEGYRAAAKAMRYEEKYRAIVADALRAQYERDGVALPLELLEKFAMPETLTVTTGHQLCLFTGPMYFIFKIVTAINLAEKTEKETGKKVVPVYWMATEDHDFDEIASVNLFGKTLTWQKPAEGAVGRLRTDSMAALLQELKTVMGESEAAVKLHAMFEEVYRPGRSLAAATRELVHRLFDGKVLVLDGDDASLKKLFIPYFREDIFSNVTFRDVSITIAELEKNGYDIQVKPRGINVFFLGENSRERIEEKEGNYHVLHSSLSFTKEGLDAELNEHPEKFSPNVTLRPVYQQVLLPNLAYVGGPGELVYWLEYKKMFETVGAFFPVLQPRNFGLLVDANTSGRLAKLGLQAENLFGEIEQIIKQFVSTEELSLDAEKENIRSAFDGVIAKAEASDVTLKKAAEAELQKALNSLEALQGKMLRAQKQKQETSVNQLRKLHAKFFPNGVLQERYENFIPYFLDQPDFIAMLLESFKPNTEGLLVMTAEN